MGGKMRPGFRPAALRTCVQLNKIQRRMSLGISTVKIIAKHTEIKPNRLGLSLGLMMKYLSNMK